MEIALVGLPRSGKTTLLNALTRGRVESGLYARQEVHAGVTGMPDPRLDGLSAIFHPKVVIPLEVKYWDVPPGPERADGGAGIGGQFLNFLQGADALLHVARSFVEPAVPHVLEAVDPHRDQAALEAELALSDLAILERRSQRIETEIKGARGHERDLLVRETSLVRRLSDELERDVPVREQRISPEEAEALSNYQLLTAKPLLVVYNIGEGDLAEAGGLEDDLAVRYGRQGMAATTVCARLEMELAQLSPDEEREFRESMGAQDRGIDRVAALSARLLSLVSFFTYVSDQVRAWAVPADTPAVRAAGKIHSDMERGFIRAEVVSFDDLVKCGSMAGCKKQGLLRLEGKTYPVQDGDVITFLFNV